MTPKPTSGSFGNFERPPSLSCPLLSFPLLPFLPFPLATTTLSLSLTGQGVLSELTALRPHVSCRTPDARRIPNHTVRSSVCKKITVSFVPSSLFPSAVLCSPSFPFFVLHGQGGSPELTALRPHVSFQTHDARRISNHTVRASCVKRKFLTHSIYFFWFPSLTNLCLSETPGYVS